MSHTINSKEVLNYLIVNKDTELLSSLMAYKEKIFEEADELELYEMLEGVFNTQHLIPDPVLLKNYSLSKGARSILEDLKPSLIKDHESATMAVNSLLYQTFINFISLDAKISLQELAKQPIDKFVESAQDFVTEFATALAGSEVKGTRETVIFGDEYIDKARARYAKAKVSGNYIVAKFGFEELDAQLGGIANNDFINILAYVKQFKSTLMRNIAYNVLLQSKNVLFLTLEMSDEEIEAEFQAMHSANKKRFGANNPLVTSNRIKEGNLDDEAEEFIFEEVIPDLANSDDLGILKIINPSEGDYFFDDLLSDIFKTRAEMTIDVIIIDYLTMVKPKLNYDRGDVNDMFKAIRKYALAHKIPVINAVQAGRGAYNEMLEDEHHRYKADAASDYNEIERSSTVMLSCAQTPEMKPSNELLVSAILSRRCSVDSIPFKAVISGNGKIVEIKGTDTPEEDTDEVLANISID